MVGLGDGLSATSAPADPAAPDDSADPTAAVAGAWAATARARPSAAAAIRLMRTASVDRQMPRIRRTHIGYEGLRSRAAIMTQMTPFSSDHERRALASLLPTMTAGLLLPQLGGRP